MTGFQQINAPDAPFIPGGLPLSVTTDVLPSFGKSVNPAGAAEFYYTKMAEMFQNGAALQSKITELVNKKKAKKKDADDKLTAAGMDVNVGSSKIRMNQQKQKSTLIEEYHAIKDPTREDLEDFLEALENLGGEVRVPVDSSPSLQQETAGEEWRTKDPQLQSQYDPKETKELKTRFKRGMSNKERHSLLEDIKKEEEQKQRDAGYPEHMINGETRRYIEAHKALFGEGSYQEGGPLNNAN